MTLLIPSSAGAISAAPVETFFDARVLTPFDKHDPAYQRDMVVAVAGRSTSTDWQPEAMPIITFLQRISESRVGRKDGPSFVMADMTPGHRYLKSVKAVTGIGLDLDTGFPLGRVYEILTAFGFLCVVYTTHSHMKTTSEFAKSALVKFGKGAQITDEMLREFAIGVRHWEPAIAGTLRYVETIEPKATGKNRTVRLKCEHAPMPKSRVIIPLAAPYVIAAQPGEPEKAIREWGGVPLALAEQISAPLDTACLDASRLFYFPRHAEGRPHEIAIFGGPLFDYRNLPREAVATPARRKRRIASGLASPQIRDLREWDRKCRYTLQMADLIRDCAHERVRGHASSVTGIVIECPFDEEHGNAGDPDDKACIAINAGDVRAERFIVTCRHGACQDYDSVDMLAKMIADGWFTREDIDDPNFHAILEDEKLPATNNDYEAAINALTVDSTDEEINAAGMSVLEAGLADYKKTRAVRTIAKNIAVKIPDVESMLARLNRTAQNEKTPNGLSVDKAKHLMTFAYVGAFHFDEAVDACKNALLYANERDGIPTFSHLNNRAVKLKTTGHHAEFEEMTQQRFWTELNRLVSFVQKVEKGEAARQKVDWHVAGQLWEQAYDMLPPACEVLHTPFFLPGGGLCITPGYHNVPKHNLNVLLLLGDLVVPEVSEAPAREEMQTSLDWLRTELLKDFPFFDCDTGDLVPREPSEANALAMLLTPFVRKMIQGRTPLFAITKPETGAGATFLAELCMRLFDGAVSPTINYTIDDDSLEKKVVATLCETRSHLFFDNVEEFNSRYLLSMLTSEKVGGRELGRSKNISERNTFNWILTGINPTIGGEMHRRTCWIRLRPDKPPTEREFRHSLDTTGELYETFVERNRGLAIHHLLTLVVYWQTQGEKLFTGRRYAGFADWTAKVGGILETCGVRGFLSNGDVPGSA